MAKQALEKTAGCCIGLYMPTGMGYSHPHRFRFALIFEMGCQNTDVLYGRYEILLNLHSP